MYIPPPLRRLFFVSGSLEREKERKESAALGMGQADTSMTKVFVGGLAWETEKESLKEHFDRYGEILEAVIIFDKATGRSKGYGFVTFKEAAAAKKACEEATPIINGRRANCNLASLGVRRIKASTTTISQPQIAVPTPKSRSMTPPPANTAAPLYYSLAPPFQHHYYGFPYYVSYGYAPSYLPEMAYNRKVSYPGGGVSGYLPLQFPTMADPEQAGLLAHSGAPPQSYPWYQWHSQRQAVAVPSHTIAIPSNPVPSIPAVIISKPPPSRPPVTVEQVGGCR